MDDLISEFITETGESLAMLDLELVKLEKHPGDAAILGTIFRLMHTIKGTCGFLGLPRLEAVAHAGENVLGKIRDKQLEATPDAITLVLEALDNIKRLIEHLSEYGTEEEGDDGRLIARLNGFAEGGNASLAAADTPFPYFRGEDEPEIQAALARLAQEQNKTAHAPKPEKPAEEAAEAREPAGAHSIRVNIDVLETLMQTVGELVLTRNQLMQIVRTKEDQDFMTPLQHLSHITTELQEGVMKTRMQPIGNAWAKFPRLIRDLSLELGKKIELKMLGAETELDRQLLEVIKDPLTHMVRNSCDHGLETPAERLAAGKSETGTVTLSAYHEGGHIIIEIQDDGRGINIERVRQKALAAGMVTEAQLETMSEKQVARFIFGAGFSTAEQVTSVSGRGVGMDVVKTNIENIGGTIELDFRRGQGSKLAINIPLTLAIVPVLLVEAQGQTFAIPQINVTELVRVAPESEYALETINGAPVMRLREKLLPLAVLSDVLGLPYDASGLAQAEKYVAVCKAGGHAFGILVDRVFDTEEIVVKPVAGILKHISVYSGNTILGDGSVIMILDPAGIMKHIGNIELSARVEPSVDHARKEGDALVGFLLFSTGHGAPKSVPLELVSRLEEIEVSSIEVAGDYPVVQYRGELMRLITLDERMRLPDSGMVEVIVFSYDKRVIGLVVQAIIDIVYTPFAIKTSSRGGKAQGLLGSMVIAGKTTDVVDVGYLLSDLADHVVPGPDSASRHMAGERRLLLVDDSPFFLNLTVPFLSSAGYKVTAAESAEKALDTIASGQKFDVIVTDLEMPGMSGFEFAACCRHSQTARDIPIVAYTASMSEDVKRRSRDAGMNDCIIKTDRAGLLETVSHWLSQDAGAGQP